MCGIAGFLGDTGGRDPRDVAAAMASTLTHRGPDDDGTWVDVSAGVGLGFRRLSIIDLSAEGHQPMRSPSGRYVVVFNGEVYNHRRLRDDIGPVAYRGTSDTEVLLAAVDRWGVRGALERANGMFALALWDTAERALYLARDRIGEKPLYYATFGGTLVFGSELKALRAHPRFRGEIDRGALAAYLRHDYVPGPLSIYEGVQKLPPATYLRVDDPYAVPEPSAYWSAIDAAARVPDVSPADAADALEEALRDSVELRMIADVPLGAFLSGGIDSSTVVALMQASSGLPVRTFTIGFSEADYDEAPHAKRVAAHLHTDHTELYVTPDDAMAVIPSLPTIYDEPFADSSQIPTYLVSRLARDHVTVSLSGDGGDELFGGYERYFVADQAWTRLARVPLAVRRLAGAAAGAMPRDRLRAMARRLGPLLSERLASVNPEHRLEVVARLGRLRRPEDLYLDAMSHWKSPASLVVGADEPPSAHLAEPIWHGRGRFEAMMLCDLLTYLPDDLLVKTDRASMAVGLEARMPMLDHRVVELAWRMPLGAKVRDGVGKRVLRDVLARHVPPDLFERPKMGFGVPIGTWLRGPLRTWGEELLDAGRLRREGYLDPHQVRERWEQHQRGDADWKYHLWTVLMFQAWLENR